MHTFPLKKKKFILLLVTWADKCVTGFVCVHSVRFSCSVVSNSLRHHESQHARTSCPLPTNSQSSLKLMSIEVVMPSSHLIFCCPLLLLPPILPSIRVFSNESTLRMRWPKYWSFSFSISPSNMHRSKLCECMSGFSFLTSTLQTLLWKKKKKNG